MTEPVKVLMVVTSHDKIDAQHLTGLWLEEFAVPYLAFRQVGYEVTVASTRGGAVPLDPNSKPTPEQERAWAEASQVLQKTLPLAQVDATPYDAVFLPGGHGTMFDLPDNSDLQKILTAYQQEGKIIAAVCHGPAGFVHAKRQDGQPLVAGRRITAFTDAEEREVKLDKAMPFLLESTLRAEGAELKVAPNWADHIEEDGNLITGQNPQSSGSTAQAVIRAIGKRHSQSAVD